MKKPTPHSPASLVALAGIGAVVLAGALIQSARGEGVAQVMTSKSLPDATVAVIDPESGTSPIVRQPPGYLIDVPAEQVDVAEFRSLVEQARSLLYARRWNDTLATTGLALALDRGPLLADLADREWVTTHAVGIAELDLDVFDLRVRLEAVHDTFNGCLRHANDVEA